MLFSKKVVDTQPPGEELGSYIDEDWEEFSSEYVGHPPNKEDETLELAVVNFLYGKSKPRSQHRTPIKHKGSTTHQIVHLFDFDSSDNALKRIDIADHYYFSVRSLKDHKFY